MSKQNRIAHSHGGEGSHEKPGDWRPNVFPRHLQRCSNIWLAGSRNIRATTSSPAAGGKTLLELHSTFKNVRHCLYTVGPRVCALQKDIFLLPLKRVRRDGHLSNADNVPSFAHLIFPTHPPTSPGRDSGCQACSKRGSQAPRGQTTCPRSHGQQATVTLTPTRRFFPLQCSASSRANECFCYLFMYTSAALPARVSCTVHGEQLPEEPRGGERAFR